jgi:hypothetical protein
MHTTASLSAPTSDNEPPQQQQLMIQQLMLKLPHLPSTSKAPWALLGQLNSLRALLLANDHPLQGRQVRLQLDQHEPIIAAATSRPNAWQLQFLLP